MKYLFSTKLILNIILIMKSYISSEAELGNAIQAIDKSVETLQKDLADGSNVASVFVGRDTRYVR